MSTATIARRHDLDALRAVAMLLGIGLHAVISFIPMPLGGWPVQDAIQDEAFGWFMAAVHGFRMPLFFLVSGFFTAMLWRKRGLKALLLHRSKRILLPLVLGMFTIIPAMWVVIIAVSVFGGISNAGITDTEPDSNLWAAAKAGDVDAIRRHLENGAEPNDRSRDLGMTPLAIAALGGHNEAVELLIEEGADVNARNRDGATALHSAAFLGHVQTVRLLIEHGADIEATNDKGESANDTTQAPWGVTTFIAGIVQVDVDREQVETGRVEVRRIFSEAGLSRGDAGERASGQEDDKQGWVGEVLVGLLMLLTLFPFFHHLWFLWFLCWLVAAFAIYAKLFDAMKLKGLPCWLVISPLRYAWLVPLTILPQALMGRLYPSFGPDTSVGLVPLPHVLFYYAIFFFFGAVYFDCPDESGRLGRWWWITVPLCLLVIFPLGYTVTSGGVGFGGWIDPAWRRPLSVLLQVLYAWLMTFGMVGLFRRFFSVESKTTRYISDSSYWLYLAHLPLIIIAQFAVRNSAIPAIAKCALICIVVSAVLLLSYQLFVRYTIIGTLLNGPRTRPRSVPIQAELVDHRPIAGGD